MIGALVAKKKARAAFNYLNRRDIQSFISIWSDDATFEYPGNLSISGKVKGKSEIIKWFNNILENYIEYHFSIKNICVKNIFDLIGSNVISVEWDINGRNRKGNKFQYSGVSIINIKKTKAISVVDYIFNIEEVKRVWSE